MGATSDCLHLKVKLKKKIYLYVNSTTQRYPNKIFNNFLFKDFSHLQPVSTTPVVYLELRISPRIFEKIWDSPNGVLRGLGETNSRKKNQKLKISWHCPCKLHPRLLGRLMKIFPTARPLTDRASSHFLEIRWTNCNDYSNCYSQVISPLPHPLGRFLVRVLGEGGTATCL